MLHVLTLTRGSTVIADGISAILAGLPIPTGTHAGEMVMRVRAAMAVAIDYTTKSTTLSLNITREHSEVSRALNHHFIGPQELSGTADCILGFDDGTALHTWTLVDALWTPVAASENSVGVRSVLQFTIAGGIFAYASAESGGTADLSDDVLNTYDFIDDLS